MEFRCQDKVVCDAQIGACQGGYLTRIRIFPFLAATVVGLVACGSVEKRRPAAQVPVAAVAPVPSPQPPAPPPAPAAKPPAAATDPAAQLIDQSEKLYAQGMTEYQNGNLEKSRQDFDQALTALLESKLDLNQDERLSAEFYKLVENIHALEAETLERGDTLGEQKYVPAPIESLAGLTFPVDPNVKARVQEQIHTVHSDLPLVSNDFVDGVITYFQGRGQGYVRKVLSRVGLYEPLISQTLRKEGLPQDLIYLAGAESAFNPLARSRQGAKGIWQLMLGRGLEYGLHKDRWVDEREDPAKSTDAAVRHLKDLYQQFADWYLAMAAYDCGPGIIQKAIEKTGYADFWTLRKLHALPAETENYVPIILATITIAKSPGTYGFDVQREPALETDSVEVSEPTDLRLVAQLIDHPVDEVIQLNPSLLRWTTPSNRPGFELHLPADTRDTFEKAIARIPEDKRIWWRVHKVEEGDTLSSVAHRYHISKASLVEANPLPPGDPLEAGARLVIPMPPGREYSLDRVHERAPRRLYRYRVHPGDTLDLIADRFDVTPYQIRRWNKLRSSHLVAGGILRLYIATGRSTPSRSETSRTHHKPSQSSSARKKASAAGSRRARRLSASTSKSGATEAPRAR